MKNLVLTAILIAASHYASAGDLGDWHDLRLKVEPLGESLLVNGWPMKISKVTGSDVGVLAKRMGDKWIAEVGAEGVRSTNNGPWKIISRIHGNGLEVVQWTGTGTDAQLLWSRSDFLARERLDRGGLRFPPGCVPGRTVSGRVDTRSYSMQAAHCKGSPRKALLSVRAMTVTQGYAVQHRGGQLLVRSGTTEINVQAWPSDDASVPVSTSLVYLRLDSPEGPK